MKRRQPLDSAGQILFGSPRWQLLVVAEDDEVGVDPPNGHEEILGIAEDGVCVGTRILNGAKPHFFALPGCAPLDPFHVAITCNDDVELTAFGGFAEQEAMTGMQAIERSEDQDFHCGRLVRG